VILISPNLRLSDSVVLGRQRQNLCELRAIIEVKQLQRASCPMTTACALHPGRVHTRDNCGFTFHGDGLAAETIRQPRDRLTGQRQERSPIAGAGS
jgi:hypothetical protein